MNENFRKLKVRQLDAKFGKKNFFNDLEMPQQGWIKELRTALGLSHRQLADRLGVSAPTVANYEKSESEGRINIDTLIKVSIALNCRLVYAVVPQSSLEKIIEEQTLKVASSLFKKVSHSMKLEQQGLKKKENKIELQEFINEVNFKMKKKIWDYEF